MVRPKQAEIDEQLKRQELDTDGSESVSGSNPVPGEDATADVDTMLADVIGNDPEEEEEGFNLGDAVNKDEKDIRDKEINDYEDTEEDELDEETKKIERKEAVTEDAATDDPYDTLGEDDDTDPDDTSEE